MRELDDEILFIGEIVSIAQRDDLKMHREPRPTDEKRAESCLESAVANAFGACHTLRYLERTKEHKLCRILNTDGVQKWVQCMHEGGKEYHARADEEHCVCRVRDCADDDL